MTVKLAVAGAFHTEFMKPAVAALEEVLAGVEIKRPRIPVISNVDAKPHSDPETIKKLLATQVSACTCSFIHSSMKQTILSHR
jgi:[acyl-carrier-protein] S-malonyltransferase